METIPGLEVVRAAAEPIRAKRADGAEMPTLDVRFSAFGNWYEIDSAWEGRFLERTAPGSFAKTIAENRDNIKILFNHGFDPSIGDKVLAPVDDLREDEGAAVGGGRLFDTSYNRDLVPGLEAGVYGSSMRFRVIKDEWDDAPGRSEHNPDGIPERTIREVRLFEFGPVTFPANPESTAAVRSLTDTYMERLRARDPERVAELMRARQSRTPVREAGPSTSLPGAATPAIAEPPVGHSGGMSPGARREALYPYLKETR